MKIRTVCMGLAAGGILALAVSGARAQQMPAGRGGAGNAPAAAGNNGTGTIGNAVEREVKGLTAEDFPEREAALKRLQALVGEQVRQRAEIQEIINALQSDLAKQERALAMVTDEEAASQVVGLMEMERGLAGWTIETMAEPVERRKALLAWGLGSKVSPMLARAYAEKRAIRVDGVKQLAGLPDEGASWTLSRLINDGDAAVRAAAMAAAWGREANGDVVAALWYRAVSGPLGHSERSLRMERLMEEAHADTMKVEFPDGDALEFGQDNDSGEFFDALLAGDVLVHLHSPMVAERVKKLVEQRGKAGKSLQVADDSEWGLVTHRLIETYKIKEAIPILANEALTTERDEMSGEMNGRPYVWSQRTMAIGVLLKLAGKEPADFQLMQVRNSDDQRGWIWATDSVPPQQQQRGRGMQQPGDGAVVRGFYEWWKEHHGEYGVQEEPSAAGVPAAPGRGRGGRGGAAQEVPVPLEIVPNGRMPLNGGDNDPVAPGP